MPNLTVATGSFCGMGCGGGCERGKGDVSVKFCFFFGKGVLIKEHNRSGLSFADWCKK